MREVHSGGVAVSSAADPLHPKLREEYLDSFGVRQRIVAVGSKYVIAHDQFDVETARTIDQIAHWVAAPMPPVTEPFTLWRGAAGTWWSIGLGGIEGGTYGTRITIHPNGTWTEVVS